MGTAVVTINGKVRQISRQAWPVMDGSNALLLVTAYGAGKTVNRYELILVDGESSKRRVLGEAPFTAAELATSCARTERLPF
jgi:hypothetical protein